MIEFPEIATITGLAADRRFIAAAAIAAMSGLVRGFSGFGGAMIYMPLVAAVYDPRVAAVTMLLVDFLASTPFVFPEFRRCTWREVLPISIAMAVAAPLGAYLLIALDPIVLRWFISSLVLGMLIVLMSGWRYRGPSTLPITFGVGLFAGVGAGAAQIAGPAVILYWISRGNAAVTLRANLMVFFLFCGIALIAVYAAQGLFTTQLVVLAVMIAIPYNVGVGIGARFFRGASDLLYRRIAYAIVALAALLSLPLLDPVLR